jgi:predicted ATPase
MKRFGPFSLDTHEECLWRDGARITMQPKPFAVLLYMVEHPGRLIPHDEFMEALWPDTFVQPQVLRTYVLEIRRLLEDDPRNPRYIESVPKRGYRFIANVIDCDAGRSDSAALSPQAIMGREAELQHLRLSLKRAADGQRQIVFVCGRPGMGKTALLDALQGSVASLPGLVSGRGHCIQNLSIKEECNPWLEALGQVPGAKVNGLADSPSRSTSELCAALEEIAHGRTLVILLEDLQWADRCTLDMLSVLARRRSPARLLVVATFNTDAGSTANAIRRLKQDLIVHRLASEIVLSPMPRTATAQLAARQLGAPVSDALASFIHERAEGIPLFIVAIAEHLFSHGAIMQRNDSFGGLQWDCHDDVDDFESSVPDHLALMIELEIQELSARDQLLLECASLFPVAFPAWGVAAAAGEPLAQVEEECHALAQRLHFARRAGLDELPGGRQSAFYTFAHGLYREVLYRRQSLSCRAERHTRTAERLAELFAGREMHAAREIAFHYEAAGNWKQAVDALRRAAQSARASRLHAVAGDFLEQAERIEALMTGSNELTRDPALSA